MCEIVRVSEIDDVIGDFLDTEFVEYGKQNGIDVNYEDFCFVAKDSDGAILGVITGHAYYNEVHIGDLIIGKNNRRAGLGSQFVKAVEDAFRGSYYDIVTLTTFGFQAPEFYKKLGFEIEFVREQEDKKLNKYFLSKKLV